MFRFIVRRLIEAIPVILGVSIIVFIMVRLIPGDPAVAMLGERATPENVAAIRERLGLEKSLPEQYFIWVGDLLQGDLGTTVLGNIPIADILWPKFAATIELSLLALFLASALGMPIGIYSAVRRNSWFDTANMFGALFGVSIPIFVLGLLLIWIFGVELKLFPTFGRDTYDPGRGTDITGMYLVDSILRGEWSRFWDVLKHIILPACTLMTIPLAVIARITRSAMLEVLNQDYIRTARAKGIHENVVIARHALRNALMPIITIIGLQLGSLLSGAVLTETIFAWPGIGRWLFDSIGQREYTVIQTVTLLIALVYVSVNLLVDMMYTVVDPRARTD